MNVTAPTSVQRNAATTETSTKTQVDYQSFLKLLVAQMKNQYPTNPMDSTQYVAQLAAFSQVEQSVQMTSKLEQMMQSSALAQADALIGRSVTSADGEISGIVEKVNLANNGVVAVLEDGRKITIGPGVVVSAGDK